MYWEEELALERRPIAGSLSYILDVADANNTLNSWFTPEPEAAWPMGRRFYLRLVQ
jgi:hypothetical protein